MMEQVGKWIDERTGIGEIWLKLFKRKIPRGVNFLYTFGAATMFLFLLQVVTGIILAMYYSNSPEHAYDSILFIDNEVTLGWLIRGLHHWGASAMVVVVVLHGAVVFYLGAYRYPREVTWIVGILSLIIVLAFSFTGYLLPWDEKAYWATVVGTNMAGTVPVIGNFLLVLLRGGTEIGAVSLARFYSFHTLLLPLVAFLLIGIHLYLVFKHGVSVPPWVWDEEEKKRKAVR